ncbi:uncharacterized protein M421DRAFT_203638 [Didymella exigua CBS 183.55]|uniref:Uncharacterized protein n=1 Tax=Didymella exigua CBS 183.55 TaxID=1150837 RepID=A0A6A5S1T1_9PLEO|nr:uncharacterized protein M421DRAFT_203638 [Didymella exigua CBS 183.55]KAF1933739.1 hypothetical protein M421DRAFT_203638 [Didymella exigua CBS 183.55]
MYLCRRKVGIKGSDVLDGPADDGDDASDVANTSWTQEVGEHTSTGDGEVIDEQTEDAAEEMDRAQREEKWMEICQEKVEIARQMCDLEDDMSVEEKLSVFDRVKRE